MTVDVLGPVTDLYLRVVDETGRAAVMEAKTSLALAEGRGAGTLGDWPQIQSPIWFGGAFLWIRLPELRLTHKDSMEVKFITRFLVRRVSAIIPTLRNSNLTINLTSKEL